MFNGRMGSHIEYFLSKNQIDSRLGNICKKAKEWLIVARFTVSVKITHSVKDGSYLPKWEFRPDPFTV
jgi:hypothetical protein